MSPDTKPKVATSDTDADAPQTRLNININSQTAKALRDYAKANGVTITEAVRRLVGVGTIITKAENDGKHVLLRDSEGMERIVFTY